MATYATLTVNAEDIIGADFDKSRASVWVEANTPHSLIVVDGTSIRVGGRRENLVDGVATFQLVTTDSADNPTSFSYRVTIVYVPKGSRKQGHDTITTSDFPLTGDANLASIDEAWDNITVPPSWRSDFRDEMNLIASVAASSATSAAASAGLAETLVISDLGTTDGQTRALIESPTTQTAQALDVTVRAGARTPFPAGLTGDRYYDLTTGTYNARGALAGVKQAIDRARLPGGGLSRIACVGHSIVAGAGPVLSGTTAWPDRLRSILTQNGVTKAGTGLVVTHNGSTARDARYIISGGWSVFTTSSHALVATVAGQQIQFVSDVASTTVDIYTFDSTQPMEVEIDGVPQTDIVGGGTGTSRKFSYTGLPNTAHHVVITTTTTGQHFVVGVECHNGDGLSLSNLGVAGATAGQWSAANYWELSATLRLIDPVLTFIEIQVNDAQLGYPDFQWKADAETIIGYARESGEAVLVIDPTPNPVAAGGYSAIPDATWLSYRQAALDLSDEYHVPVLDLSEIYGPHSRGVQLGLMLDSVHPTVPGAEVIARAAADMLL